MNGNYTSNGIYTVHEVGWTPKFGPERELEGKYVFGGYIWGQPNSPFTPTSYKPYSQKAKVASSIDQFQWGLYWQADQRLYAVKENQADTTLDAAPGATIRRVTQKGLYSINVVSYTPPENCILPFYAHTGLVYRGLVPKRDDDMLGFVAAFGVYSANYNQWLQGQNQALYNNYGSKYNGTVPDGPTTARPPNATTGRAGTATTYWAYRPMFTSTEELEGFYSIQINRWSTVKPYAQYIVNPAANGTLGNEWILGVRLTAAF
jgi:hypothetical protein